MTEQNKKDDFIKTTEQDKPHIYGYAPEIVALLVKAFGGMVVNI